MENQEKKRNCNVKAKQRVKVCHVCWSTFALTVDMNLPRGTKGKIAMAKLKREILPCMLN